eukprot:tig00000802_g4258.t1
MPSPPAERSRSDWSSEECQQAHMDGRRNWRPPSISEAGDAPAESTTQGSGVLGRLLPEACLRAAQSCSGLQPPGTDSRRSSAAEQSELTGTSKFEMPSPTPPMAMRTSSVSGISKMFKSASGLSLAMQRSNSVSVDVGAGGPCSAPAMFCCCEVRGPSPGTQAGGDRRSPGSAGSGGVLQARDDGPSVARKYSCVNDILKELSQKNAALRSMNLELQQARELVDDKEIEMQMMKEQHDEELALLRRELAAVKSKLASQQSQQPQPQAGPAEAAFQSAVLCVDVPPAAAGAGAAEAGERPHAQRAGGERRNSSETSSASCGTVGSDLPPLMCASSTASYSSISSPCSTAHIGSPELEARGGARSAPRSPSHSGAPPAVATSISAPDLAVAAASPPPTEAGVVASLLMSELPMSSSWSMKFARRPPTVQDLFQRIRALELSNGELRTEITMKDELITVLKRGKPASPGPCAVYRATPVAINSPRPYHSSANPSFPWN